MKCMHLWWWLLLACFLLQQQQRPLSLFGVLCGEHKHTSNQYQSTTALLNVMCVKSGFVASCLLRTLVILAIERQNIYKYITPHQLQQTTISAAELADQLCFSFITFIQFLYFLPPFYFPVRPKKGDSYLSLAYNLHWCPCAVRSAVVVLYVLPFFSYEHLIPKASVTFSMRITFYEKKLLLHVCIYLAC